MKVITRCVINMETLEIEKEESYEYSGSITKCKGGGGASGTTDFPDYVKEVHAQLLSNTALGVVVLTDNPSSSIIDILDTAVGSSPWSGQVAYDPATDIIDVEAYVDAFAAILAGLNDDADWAALYSQAETSIGEVGGISAAEINDEIDAFADQLDDQIDTDVLPRFESGMRDINMVTSSAFSIGRAVIEGFRDRDVTKFGTQLRITAAEKNADIELNNKRLHIEGSTQMVSMRSQRLSSQETLMRAGVESKRIKIVAKKEESDFNMEIDKKDALWDIEAYQYAANMLASASGGVESTGTKGPSTSQSVLGGAMSGAAAGGMVGGPWGAVAGGVLGAASGLL